MNKIHLLLSRTGSRSPRKLIVAVSAALLAGTATLGVSAAGAQDEAPSLASLDRIQSGEWELRFRSDVPRRRLCIHNGRDFIQLRHPRKGCSQYVVEDLADRVSVQYTCRGDGYGLTNIRLETPSLIQLESQGIAAGSPYHISAEARRVGACR